jgi:hypothetical protein
MKNARSSGSDVVGVPRFVYQFGFESTRACFGGQQLALGVEAHAGRFDGGGERQLLLRTVQENVLGLGSADISQPVKAGVAVFLSFVIGAAIPLLPFSWREDRRYRRPARRAAARRSSSASFSRSGRSSRTTPYSSSVVTPA